MGVSIQYRRKELFWDTLYFGLKSPYLQFLPSDNLLPYSHKNKSECISDLKVICAQSWGCIEAFRDHISPKTSSQQPYS